MSLIVLCSDGDHRDLRPVREGAADWSEVLCMLMKHELCILCRYSQICIRVLTLAGHIFWGSAFEIYFLCSITPEAPQLQYFNYKGLSIAVTAQDAPERHQRSGSQSRY